MRGDGKSAEAAYCKCTVEGEGRRKVNYVKVATHAEGKGVNTGVLLYGALELEAP